MKISNFLEAMEREVPARYACSWDHVGLLVGDRDAEVRRILVALDAGDEAVRLAEERECDLIVTHHPLLFHPMERVLEQDVIGRRVRRMIRSGISYFAMHTNFDIVKMADINARDLGLLRPCVLEKIGEDERGVYGFLVASGVIPEMPNVIAIQSEHCAPFAEAKRQGLKVPAAVTPEPTLAEGIAIIDAGHYGTEFCFINYTVHMLQTMFPDTEVIGQEIRQPYTIL